MQRGTPTFAARLFSTVIALSLCGGSWAVEFVLPDEAGAFQAAYVVGSFNGWQAAVSPMSRTVDGFRLSLAVSDGEHQYKFLALPAGSDEGVWLLDYSSAVYVRAEEGEWNNYLNVSGGVAVGPPATALTFEHVAPGAHDVVLSGDFNSWEQGALKLIPDGEGTWRCSLVHPLPITYKFVVDDIWVSDNDARGRNVTYVPDGYGRFNTVWLPERGVAQEYLFEPSTGRFIQQSRSLAGGRFTLDTQDELDLVEFSRATVDDLAALRREFVASGELSKANEIDLQIISRFPEIPVASDAMMAAAKYELYSVKSPERARAILYSRLGSVTEQLAVADSLLWIGVTHFEEGDYESASVPLLESLDLFDSRPTELESARIYEEVLFYLACTRYHTGQLVEARELFQRVVNETVYPRSQNAQFARRWISKIDSQTNSTSE
ncbi:MAG: tetratricopeptide repeat protein [Candidatus Sumerlaeia bacterium]|nr:tetratricopeptide repeat protein [Candidatus Sumerlaeia bacterium]